MRGTGKKAAVVALSAMIAMGGTPAAALAEVAGAQQAQQGESGGATSSQAPKFNLDNAASVVGMVSYEVQKADGTQEYSDSAIIGKDNVKSVSDPKQNEDGTWTVTVTLKDGLTAANFNVPGWALDNNPSDYVVDAPASKMTIEFSTESATGTSYYAFGNARAKLVFKQKAEEQAPAFDFSKDAQWDAQNVRCTVKGGNFDGSDYANATVIGNGPATAGDPYKDGDTWKVDVTLDASKAMTFWFPSAQADKNAYELDKNASKLTATYSWTGTKWECQGDARANLVFAKKAPAPEAAIVHIYLTEDEASDTAVSANVGDKLSSLKDWQETPTRKGYTFKGWNTKKDGSGETVTGDTKIPSDWYAVYAQWEANAEPKIDANDSATITADKISGKDWNEQVAVARKALVKSATDASGRDATDKVELTFMKGGSNGSWAFGNAETGDYQVVLSLDGVTKTVTLTVKAAEPPAPKTVTWTYYQDPVDKPDQKVTHDYTVGDAFPTAWDSHYAKPGYTFKGYTVNNKPAEGVPVFRTPADLAKYIASATSGKIDASMNFTLYAVWEKNPEPAPKTVTWSFYDDSNATDPAKTVKLTVGSKLDAWAYTPAKDGYKFVGYSVNYPDGAVFATPSDFLKVYNQANPTATTDSVTAAMDGYKLYAHWTKVETPAPQQVTVRFFDDATDAEPTVRTYTDGQQLGEVPVPSAREGYTFKGYKTALNDSPVYTVEQLEQTKAYEGMPDLYGVWEANEPAPSAKLNIQFIDSIDNSVMSNYGGEPGDSWYYEPTREGYEFSGWTYDREGTMPASKDDLNTTTGDVRLFAQWKKAEVQAPTISISWFDRQVSVRRGQDVRVSFSIDQGTGHARPSDFGLFLSDGTMVARGSSSRGWFGQDGKFVVRAGTSVYRLLAKASDGRPVSLTVRRLDHGRWVDTAERVSVTIRARHFGWGHGWWYPVMPLDE